MSSATAEAMFRFFDDNDDKGLSFDELKDGMKSVGSNFSDTEVRAFFDKYDKDQNGIIDFNEFLGLCIDINTNDSEKAVATLFSSVDKDNNRSLTHSELREGIAQYTGKPVDDAEVSALIKQLDIDRDGEVSYEEFTNNILVKMSVAMKGGRSN